MTAYYNEIDPYAAQWLENLISAGHIAPGDVDRRSIVDITPSELAKYTQCHFFAGVGVWSYALRRAGWPDERPVWTGSCPCQPFSAAGQGGGFDDERHLWPAFYHLIDECRPDALFGEQVASKDGLAWLDLVQADMEAAGYAFGAFDLCAAGFGAPHIRQRLYWLANNNNNLGHEWSGSARRRGIGPSNDSATGALANNNNSERRADAAGGHERDGKDARRSQGSSDLEGSGGISLVVDADHEGPQRHGRLIEFNAAERRETAPRHSSSDGMVGELAYADGGNASAERQQCSRQQRQQCSRQQRQQQTDSPSRVELSGPANGPWRDADWLLCRDGKWRPVRPGSFPLAHGAASRVGRLRAYGNAIVASQAEAFVSAFLEVDAGVRS